MIIVINQLPNYLPKPILLIKTMFTDLTKSDAVRIQLKLRHPSELKFILFDVLGVILNSRAEHNTQLIEDYHL